MVPGAPRPWTWLRQVHGAATVVVDHPGQHAGADADAAVTAAPGCALAVRTADCAPIVLAGERAVGVVHAGWRGLMGGVVDAAVGALRALDPAPVVAHLGPCIHAGCYEFDGPEREELVARFGPSVAATTTWGAPAVDLPAAVHAALAALDVPLATGSPGCTACGPGWYSHRARQEAQRIATVAWLEPA